MRPVLCSLCGYCCKSSWREEELLKNTRWCRGCDRSTVFYLGAEFKQLELFQLYIFSEKQFT